MDKTTLSFRSVNVTGYRAPQVSSDRAWLNSRMAKLALEAGDPSLIRKGIASSKPEEAVAACLAVSKLSKDSGVVTMDILRRQNVKVIELSEAQNVDVEQIAKICLTGTIGRVPASGKNIALNTPELVRARLGAEKFSALEKKLVSVQPNFQWAELVPVRTK